MEARHVSWALGASQVWFEDRSLGIRLRGTRKRQRSCSTVLQRENAQALIVSSELGSKIS